MNLSSLDLNLLLVFDAVMAERNVTRAGERVGLSQPAVSNALARLRHHLKDELFVRGADGMRPTPRAAELAEPVRHALAEIERALDSARFEPKISARTFRIASPDYTAAILLPALAAHLEREAPGVDIRMLPLQGRSYEMLDNQEIDFALSTFADLPSRFDALPVLEEDFVVMMREGHPLLAAPLTVEAFAAAKHLLVSVRGDAHGFVDDGLAGLGLARRIALTVNQFTVAPAIVAASDMVLTLPSRMATGCAAGPGVRTVPCPVEAPPEFRELSLVWHARLGQHPAHTWFRETVRAVAATL